MCLPGDAFAVADEQHPDVIEGNAAPQMCLAAMKHPVSMFCEPRCFGL